MVESDCRTPGCHSVQVGTLKQGEGVFHPVHVVAAESRWVRRERSLWRVAIPLAMGAVATVLIAQGSGNRTSESVMPLRSSAQIAQSAHAAAQKSVGMKELYKSATAKGKTTLSTVAAAAPSYYKYGPSYVVPPRPGSGSTGYHLVWIPAAHTHKKAHKYMKDVGGRDEVPYFPLPEKVRDGRGSHAMWVPDDCDSDGDGQVDDECKKQYMYSTQYPDRSDGLVTTQFPAHHYVPTTTYPYIKGPYLHHLVDGTGKAYTGYHGGHWVWVGDNDFSPPDDIYQPPPYGQAGR